MNLVKLFLILTILFTFLEPCLVAEDTKTDTMILLKTKQYFESIGMDTILQVQEKTKPDSGKVNKKSIQIKYDLTGIYIIKKNNGNN